MYVMADLSRRDEPATGSDRDSKTLLCTVTYDEARKLLTISPDVIGDDDHYDVSNSSGIKYNYWIEHVSEEQTPLELQRQCEDTRHVSTSAVRDGGERIDGGSRSSSLTASPSPRRKAGLFVENGDPDVPGRDVVRLFALRGGYIYIRSPPR